MNLRNRPALAACVLFGALAHSLLVAAERPNVLFIAVDDLNHWVGHLGRNSQTKTPAIDRLARMGVTFTHAYIRYQDGGEELYDHSNDEYELTNLAGKGAEFEGVKKELAKSFPKVNNPPIK